MKLTEEQLGYVVSEMIGWASMGFNKHIDFPDGFSTKHPEAWAKYKSLDLFGSEQLEVLLSSLVTFHMRDNEELYDNFGVKSDELLREYEDNEQL